MSKLTQEAIKIDSKISSMRIAFFWMIRVIIIIAVLSVIGSLLFSWVGKQFQLSGIVALIGVLGTVAFGGKAVQSFSEKNETSVSQTITNTIAKIIPKVSGSEEEPKQ